MCPACSPCSCLSSAVWQPACTCPAGSPSQIPAHNLCSQPAPACLRPLHAPWPCRQPVPALSAASSRTSAAAEGVVGNASGASSALMLPKRDPFSDVKLGPLLGRGSYGQAGLHLSCAITVHAPAHWSAATLALRRAAALCDQHPLGWHSTLAINMVVSRWPLSATGPDGPPVCAPAQASRKPCVKQGMSSPCIAYLACRPGDEGCCI